jgi:hypothetical protein
MDEKTAPVSNTFDSLMRNQRNGEFQNEVSRAVMEAVEAVKAHRKPATVKITLRLEPANVDVSAMSITDEVDVKLPKPEKENSLFFTTDENLLVTDNPKQRKLEFDVVQTAPREEAAAAKTQAAG